LRLDKLCLQSRWRVVGDAFELKEHAGHRLPDLIVKPPSDPQPLGLLRREGPLTALTTLLLEPIEHLVESLDELPHLLRPRRGKPLSRTEKVHVLHTAGESLERGEAGPEENQIGDD
jgi:hypothetical protein